MFVALDLPGVAREAIARWRDELIAGRADLRPVAPEALHVTVAFLAWQNDKDVERIAAAAFAAAAGLEPPLLTPDELRSVPPRRPRLFALDLGDDGERATALQGDVARALEKARFYEPEARPFWPHITLARVKRGAHAADLTGPGAPSEPFTADRITLYRSVLRPQGALYEPLARATVGEPYG